MADPVYDPEQGDHTRPPGLGLPSSDAPAFAPPSKTYPSDESTAGGERSGNANPSSNSATEKEQAALDGADRVGKGFPLDGLADGAISGSGAAQSGNSPKEWLTRKKIQVVSVGLGLVAFLGIGGMTVQNIPFFHLLHADKILGVVDQMNTNNKDTGVVHFLRAIRSGDLPKTRLGVVQFEKHDSLIKSLRAKGITIYANKVGQLNFVTVNVTKTFPDLAKEKPSVIRKALAERYAKHGLTYDKVSISSTGGNGTRVMLDLRDASPIAERMVLKDVSRTLGWGKRAYYMPYRHMKTYFSVSDLLHPLRSTQAKVQNKISTTIDAWFPSKANLDGRAGGFKARLADFRTKYSSQLRTTGIAVASVGAACTVYGIADSALQIQQVGIVEPGVKQTTALRAAANQGEAGVDTSNEAMTALVDSEYKDGKWLANGKEWARLTGMPEPTYTSAEEATYGVYRNAFDPNSSLKVFLAGMNYAQIAGKGMGDFCKDQTAQIGLAALGVGLVILSIPTTGGAGALVAWGALTAGGAAVGYAATETAAKTLTPMLAGAIPDVVDLAGGLGGDLAVFSAVKSGNIATASEGMLTSSTGLAAQQKEVAENRIADAKTKSFYERALDPSSPSTLAGIAIDKVSPSMVTNIAQITNGIASIGSTVAKLPTLLLTGRSSAASYQPLSNTISSYDALSEMGDNFNDNEQAVASLYDSERSSGSTKYFDLALECNGNQIELKNKPSFGDFWDVTNVKMIDTDSIDYRTHCARPEILSDTNYKKMVASFSMTSTGEGLSCSLVNDEDSCAKLGMGSAGTAFTPDLTASANAVGQATLSRAQGSWGGYTNGKLGGSGAEDYKKVLTPISSVGLTGCSGSISVPYLHPDVAAAAKVLNDEYTKHFGYGLIFESCYRTYDQQQTAWANYQNGGNLAARPGTSNHGWGLAIDVAMSRYGGFSSPNYKWLAENGPSYGFRAGVVSSEAWHIEYARTVGGVSGGGSGGSGSSSW